MLAILVAAICGAFNVLTKECLLTCSRRVKSLPQMSQLKERTPEWMTRCLLRVRRCLAM